MSALHDEILEEDLCRAFADAYNFVHPHLKDGFMREDGQSKGLSTPWNALFFGADDGDRDSFRNLIEHLSVRSAAGSCRLQQLGQKFSWSNSRGCAVEEPHPGVYVFRSDEY
jgi:hypothetical protein